MVQLNSRKGRSLEKECEEKGGETWWRCTHIKGHGQVKRARVVETCSLGGETQGLPENEENKVDEEPEKVTEEDHI